MNMANNVSLVIKETLNTLTNEADYGTIIFVEVDAAASTGFYELDALHPSYEQQPDDSWNLYFTFSNDPYAYIGGTIFDESTSTANLMIVGTFYTPFNDKSYVVMIQPTIWGESGLVSHSFAAGSKIDVRADVENVSLAANEYTITSGNAPYINTANPVGAFWGSRLSLTFGDKPASQPTMPDSVGAHLLFYAGKSIAVAQYDIEFGFDMTGCSGVDSDSISITGHQGPFPLYFSYVKVTVSNDAGYVTYVMNDGSTWQTPEGMALVASTGSFGHTILASNEIVIAGTDMGSAVTPAGVKAYFDNRLASATETVAGIVELATDTEAKAGTDTTRATTPAGVKAHVDSRLVAASETVSGIVELATNAETVTGTDTARAVTPAGLTAALAGVGGTTNVRTYLDSEQYRKFGTSGFHATWQASPLGTSAPGAAVSTSTASSASTTYFIPFVVPRAITVSALSVVVATLASGSSCKVGLYNTDNTSTTTRTTAPGGKYRPTTVIAQSGALDCASTGTKTYTLGTPATLQPGLYMFAVIVSTGTTLRIHMRTAVGGDGDMDVLWRDRAANTTVPYAFTTTAPGTTTSATFPDNPSITSGTTLVANAPIVYFNYTLA